MNRSTHSAPSKEREAAPGAVTTWGKQEERNSIDSSKGWRLTTYAWPGLALSSMFFYPLSSSLIDGPYYMQWQWAHSVEFLVAWLGIAAFVTPLLWFSLERLGARLGLVALVATILIPLASMGIHLIRQLGFADALMATSRWALTAGLMVPAFTLLVLLVHPRLGRWRERLRATLAIALLIGSPISLVSLLIVGKAGFQSEPSSFEMNGSGTPPVFAAEDAPASIRVILFDELDYGYLYKNFQVRNSYPNFQGFAAIADNFHEAKAPAGATMSSIPGLLLGRGKLEVELYKHDAYIFEDGKPTMPVGDAKKNLFSIAQSRGLRTRLYAAYHPHCRIFRKFLDECDATSIYNFSTLDIAFSPLHPIFTNLILWPKDKPFGYVKAFVYAPFHKAHVDRVFRLSVAALDDRDPAFEFVHYQIPHLPFIYDARGFNPPEDQYLQNDENYENQLAYVDRLFGEYLDVLKRAGHFKESTVVVMSDHAYRKMREEAEWSRIPLLVKRPGQSQRRDVEQTVAAGLIIRCLVEGDRGCYEAQARGY